MVTIRRITSLDENAVNELCILLQDAVEGGASVGFLWPLTTARAKQYWQDVHHALADNLILWVAELEGKIVGSVQFPFV
ncbi:MAG: hypothetical protein ORN98_09995 [Alphaproteobacteria bacterium]|nr:hypothetical protein [Alphaproteobacteria bacterium]